jgi:hypothetical protein
MTSSQETTYYQDSTVTISNSRAVLGAKTYAMVNITSVSMGEKPANRTPGIALALIGLAIAACTGSMGGNSAGGGIGIGVVLIIAGIALAAIVKPSYIVRIGSAGGESDALVSNNREYIQKLVSAVNEAIIKRG